MLLFLLGSVIPAMVTALYWFPSAMSFVVSILDLYDYSNARDKCNSNDAATLLNAFLRIIISIFFGANLYVYTGGLVRKLPVV